MGLTIHGLELAVHITTSHFGALVGKVCRCLLEKGSLTLQSVQQSTEIPKDRLKKCLLVLIQHNCVQAFSISSDDDGPAQKNAVLYTAIYDNILHRLRFSKFLQVVGDRLGSECEELLMGLLQHGRQTLESIIARVMSIRKEDSSDAQSVHRENFVKLADARFVERCPAAQPVVKLEEKDLKKKRGAKFAGEAPTIEQRAIADAAEADYQRFCVMDSTRSDSDGLTSQQRDDITTGMKRKYDAFDMDGGNMAAISEKETHWRANFEELVRCLRHKACVANVRSNMDVKTGSVLEAILEASRSSEGKVKEDTSIPLSMNAILQELMGKSEGLEMTSNHVEMVLNQLGCITSVEKGMELYSIDLKSIIERAKHGEVEAMVLNRHGREAYRIFRLLAKDNHYIETNQIADAALVEKKEASVILLRLWKDGFLDMERMSTTLPRQAIMFVWKVKKDTLWEHVLDMIYHAALNLIHRIAYEHDQELELLNIHPQLRTEAQQKRYIRYRKVKLLLEASLLKIDDAIMLLHDF